VKIHIAITKTVDIAYQNNSCKGLNNIVLLTEISRRILRMFKTRSERKLIMRIFILLLSFIFGVVRFRMSKR